MRQLLFSFCLYLFLGSSTILATPYNNNPTFEQKIEKAENLIANYRNDSALIYLQEIFEEIKEQNLDDSPLGLEIQLAIGIALKEDDQTERALRLLHQIKDKSKQAKQWTIYSTACLSLANLEEGLSRSIDTRAELEDAREVIQKYELDSLQAQLMVQMASWYQKFGFPDSAKLYANQALKQARILHSLEIEADSYIVLGNLEGTVGYLKSIEFYNKSIKIRKQLSDHYRLAQQWHHISDLYLKYAQNEQALIYNDSSITACYQTIENGREKIYTLHEAYLVRALAFRNVRQLDSAIYYLRRGYSEQLRYIEQQEKGKLIEIGERFKNEQKTQQIKEQARQIRSERQRLVWLLSFAALIVVFSSILAYYYIRLKNANQRTLQQSKTIQVTNNKLARSLKQQIMLQGEIHHRVKNNLQVIVSLLELQKEEIKEEATKASLESMSGRIYSMAAVHEVLYQKEGENLVDFLEYTQKICGHVSNFTLNEKPRFNLKIPRQSFNLETLMPLGIILNELLTNSLKHAYQKGKQLHIDIKLMPIDNGYYLLYSDNGPGFATGQLMDRKGGLGAYLLRSMSRQLMGRIETKNEIGAAYSIYFQEKNKN